MMKLLEKPYCTTVKPVITDQLYIFPMTEFRLYVLIFFLPFTTNGRVLFGGEANLVLNGLIEW